MATERDTGPVYGADPLEVMSGLHTQAEAERDAALLDVKARALVIREQSELVERLRAEVARLSSPPDDAEVERAAKALCRETADNDWIEWQDYYRNLAVAALTAARECKEQPGNLNSAAGNASRHRGGEPMSVEIQPIQVDCPNCGGSITVPVKATVIPGAVRINGQLAAQVDLGARLIEHTCATTEGEARNAD